MTVAATLPSSARWATRLVFFASGFALACWAPLVPLAKVRLGIDEGALGLLLLCLGGGSVVAMQAAGAVAASAGARPMIIASGIGLAAFLPLLALAPSLPGMAATLLAFGACLGAIDVAMNVHAVEVERRASVPLMSGFHGLFSVGGFAGATLMTLALSFGLNAVTATIGASSAVLAAVLVARPRLIDTPRSAEGPLFVRPRGIVILLAVLAGVAFLAEGAMLDWSALLLTQRGLFAAEQAGIGYGLFAAAMTVGRFAGDAVALRLGDRRTLASSGLLATAGFAALLVAPVAAWAIAALLLIGLGAANIVPVLFRKAGNQSAMPPTAAVAAVTLIGYAGVLAGPAAIGFVAQATSLATAFWLLAGLVAAIPLASGLIDREASLIQETR